MLAPMLQAPFPVESLVSTASLKVVGNFLAKSGAPNERFERKASSVCALHRLPLCVFCSQFFDPDFPDGIVPPRGYTLKYAPSTSIRSSIERGKNSGEGNNSKGKTPMHTPEANGLVPYFDDRFPDRYSETPGASYTDTSRPLETCDERGVSLAGEGGGVYCGRGIAVGGREARELRKAGDLVRGGFSIRDKLLSQRPDGD